MFDKVTAAQYLAGVKGQPRRSKYNNKHVKFDGKTFDSEKEKNRYVELSILQALGVIKDLKLQVRYLLIPADRTVKGDRPTYYVADFVYLEPNADGAFLPICEDCKGFKTPVYRLKKKLLRAKYKIKIRET